MLFEHKAKSECFFGNPVFAGNLFCNLSAEALESLTRVKQTRRFPKGAVIFAQGDLPSGIYVLLKGQAQLSLNPKPDKKHIFRPVEPNEILGLTETIANLPYGMNAETLAPCLFEFIERRQFIDFLYDEPRVCFHLAELLGLNLQKSYALLRSSII